MAQITICDICRTRENVNRITLTYDRSMDGAGSMDDDCECFDLCEKHELAAYKRLIKKRYSVAERYEFNDNLINEIREEIK